MEICRNLQDYKSPGDVSGHPVSGGYEESTKSKEDSELNDNERIRISGASEIVSNTSKVANSVSSSFKTGKTARCLWTSL